MPLTNFLKVPPHLIEPLDDTLPVNNARLADVVELEHNKAVGQVVVDVVHVGTHAHAVHPVAVRCKKKSYFYYNL